MKNLVKKIFSLSKNLNDNESSFDKLKKDRSISLLFSAIDNYSATSTIRYVGGCTRKILNNEKVDDIDFAVNLEPSECINALKKKILNFMRLVLSTVLLLHLSKITNSKSHH